MTDRTDSVDDMSPISSDPVFASPPKRGRRRVAATIVGAALLGPRPPVPARREAV